MLMKTFSRVIELVKSWKIQRTLFIILAILVVSMDVQSCNTAGLWHNPLQSACQYVWMFAIFLLIAFPRQISLVTPILYCVTLAVPSVNATCVLFSLIASMFVAGFYDSWKYLLCAYIVSLNIMYFAKMAYIPFTFPCFILISMICGYALRKYLNMLEENNRAKMDIVRSKFQSYIASVALQLHDDVNNEITDITLLATDALYAENNEHTKESLEQIVEHSRNALSKARLVISLLEQAEQKYDDSLDSNIASTQFVYGSNSNDRMNLTDFLCNIRARLQAERQICEQLGYYGSLTVVDKSSGSGDFTTSATVSTEKAQCAIRMCSELLTNIRKHCNTSVDFSMNVTVDERECKIMCMNSISTLNKFGGRLVFGKGLLFHKKSVERLGGSLSAQKDDDTWLVNVVIPLN
ncbi:MULTISPECIES: histidine kinase dimerization/phosphoacceptor domain-containing protein [Gardnerella]|uniref:Signal transduction histidine kinase-like protein n=1 Tax=Gardnerella greenwoodii 00703Dmash TaxID=698960 RepID=I4MBC0_9BIFI|nr:histidine kinase dimerization/phosphoacceptor domain-containing protein [Gardnerella greenwoodii]EIK86510.1 Signal transduction histidine kinase-like protein [Gardnerella greenwoodii 00703Dmash]